MFYDAKDVIRSRILKDRQYNSHIKKNRKSNNDLYNITQKTKDRTTRSPLKTRDELRCTGRVGW